MISNLSSPLLHSTKLKNILTNAFSMPAFIHYPKKYSQHFTQLKKHQRAKKIKSYIVYTVLITFTLLIAS